MPIIGRGSGHCRKPCRRRTGRAISPQRLFVAGSGSVAGRSREISSRHISKRSEAKYPNDRRKLKSKSHLLCPWVDEIARKSHLLDVYEDLIGPNILCYSMAFRIKEADGKTFAGWHQDGAYNPIKPILVIGGLALSDCTVEHGCLSVIPGSHKTGTLPHEDTGNPDSILSRGQYITKDFDESTAVNMELKAGEIGLFYSEIIHGSSVNTSDARRIIVLVEMMPTHVHAHTATQAWWSAVSTKATTLISIHRQRRNSAQRSSRAGSAQPRKRVRTFSMAVPFR